MTDVVSGKKIKVGILGSSGYGGAGLLRRLLKHPQVEVTGLGSRQYENQTIAACWPQLAGLSDLSFFYNRGNYRRL